MKYMSKRTKIIDAISVASVVIVVGAIFVKLNTDSAKYEEIKDCTVVYGDTDSGAVLPIGIDYDGKKWIMPNGKIVGYSSHEDTAIFKTKECAK